MKTKRSKVAILYFCTIVFWGIFYYFLPFAGDDWAWGSSLGMDRLANAFDGYNGRYIGNLLIILITRSMVARVVICTAIMFLLILIMSKIFNSLSKAKDSVANYITAFASVLVLIVPNQIAFGELQPFQIFGSTIGWLSGFTNYVVPSVLILVYYYYVTTKGHESKWIYAMLVIDGAIACLCVEHYTLFCVLFSFCVIAYIYYCYKRICKKSLSFLIGSVLGALIMFTNSSYTSMQKGDVSQNQRAVGFLGSFKQYAAFIFGKNASTATVVTLSVVLIIIIAGVLLLLAKKTYKAFMDRSIGNLLPIICMVVMTLPLLFTNSGKEIYVVAPRCYFLQYFLLVIYIYNNIATKNKLDARKLKSAISICCAVLIVITGVLFFQLDQAGAKRDKVVDNAIEKGYSTVEIIEYPKNIEHVQWASNFVKTKTYLERYKNFKGIANDTKTEITKYK